jgi:hypothetical protein
MSEHRSTGVMMAGYAQIKARNAVNTSTSDSAPRPSAGTLALALFISLMIGLATGALWLVFELAHPGIWVSIWLALPIGWVLGLVIRSWVLDAGLAAAVLALFAVLLASAYMRFLMAAANISGMFGISFLQALHRAGAGMLLQLAWTSVSAMTAGIYLLAAVLGATAAARTWRLPRRPKANKKP